VWRRFRDWLAALAAQGVWPNIGAFLGGGTLRPYACALRMGRATADELATMPRVMAEARAAGAFGGAYALIDPPDAFVDTDELVAVCDVVAAYRGISITHVRNQAAQLATGVRDVWVNGQRVLLSGQHTGATPGRFVAHQARA